MTNPGNNETAHYGAPQPTYPQQYGPPAGYPQSPAPGYAPPPQTVYMQAPPEPKNGLGLAAFIIALVGLLICLVPIAGAPIGGPASIVAFILALVAISRVRKGKATNKKIAWWAFALSVACFAAAIGDLVILVNAANDLGNCVDATSNALNHLNDQGAQDAATKACQK